jgi:hypothetical protein
MFFEGCEPRHGKGCAVTALRDRGACSSRASTAGRHHSNVTNPVRERDATSPQSGFGRNRRSGAKPQGRTETASVAPMSRSERRKPRAGVDESRRDGSREHQAKLERGAGWFRPTCRGSKGNLEVGPKLEKGARENHDGRKTPPLLCPTSRKTSETTRRRATSGRERQRPTSRYAGRVGTTASPRGEGRTARPLWSRKTARRSHDGRKASVNQTHRESLWGAAH